MLFIIAILIVANIVLSFKLMNKEAENLGKVSSLKLELKEKEKEIDNLQRKIRELNYNDDVEV